MVILLKIKRRDFSTRQHSYFGVTHCENSEVQIAVFSKKKHATGLETCTKIYFLYIFNLVQIRISGSHLSHITCLLYFRRSFTRGFAARCRPPAGRSAFGLCRHLTKTCCERLASGTRGRKCATYSKIGFMWSCINKKLTYLYQSKYFATFVYFIS